MRSLWRLPMPRSLSQADHELGHSHAIEATVLITADPKNLPK